MSVSTLARHHGYLEGVGGLRLHYRTWDPAEPRAAVLVVHGLGEHGGRYEWLAEALAGRGIASFALDLRGHGRSDGRRGHVSRFDVFLQDVDRFRREAQGLLDPQCPVFLFAHSLGALIALRYLQEFDAPIRGAILSSPWMTGPIPLPSWGSALAGALGRVLPAVRLLARTRPAVPGRDPKEDDPLVHEAFTPRLFREASAAMQLLPHRWQRIRTPLLFLLGDEDRGAAAGRRTAFVRSLEGGSLDVRRYPGRGHEVLGGADVDDAFADLVAWLEDRIEESTAGSAANAGPWLAPGRAAYPPDAGP